MALTRRGRTLTALFSSLAIVATVVGVLIFGGAKGGGAAQGTPPDGAPASTSPPPALCPLTGAKPKDGSVPNRPALAVKVENLPAARPQMGLSYADLIYEEPVEAGITRFIAVYQCQDAARIEPVRSGRLTDPPVLVQFGTPLFAYAGGVPKVIAAVHAAGIVDVNYLKVPGAYGRDSARAAPHNLDTSTRELYAAAGGRGSTPRPVFTYADNVPVTAMQASTVHVPFSAYSDVYWRWSASKDQWMRSYGTTPATYSDGVQMSVQNVVIQMVNVKMTDITDVNGVHSPEVVSTGSGKAYILRNGQVIMGTWSRKRLSDQTTFRDAHGDLIPLEPGRTWVELTPTATKVTVR